MKKGRKVVLWVAVGCIALGGVLTAAGWAAGGGKARQEHSDKWQRLGSYVVRWSNDGRSGKAAKDGVKTYSGDFTEEIPYTGDLKELQVEVGIHGVHIEEGGGEAIYLEGENCEQLQCYVEGNTLYLKDVGKHDNFIHSDKRTVTLTLPEGSTWEKAVLEAAMGYIEVERLQAEEARLETGMGAITIQHAQLGKVDIRADMGSVEVAGSIGKDVDAQANMGSILLELEQGQQEFNYQIESAMGSVSLGDEEYAGLSKALRLPYGAARDMKLEAAMGSIEISFE